MSGERMSAHVTRPGTISSSRWTTRARSAGRAWAAGRADEESAERSSGEAGGKAAPAAVTGSAPATAPDTSDGGATASAVMSPEDAAATGSGTLADRGQPLLVLRQPAPDSIEVAVLD